MASIDTICTPSSFSSAASSVIAGTMAGTVCRCEVRCFLPATGGHPYPHDRRVLCHVDPRDDLIAQLVVLVLHHLRAHPSLLLLPRGHRASLSWTSGIARRAARGPGQQAHASRSLTSALTAAESDPQGQVPAPGCKTGSDPTNLPASRAARHHPTPPAGPHGPRTPHHKRGNPGQQPTRTRRRFTRTRPSPMRTAVKPSAQPTFEPNT